jgi:competence protein ComEC
MTSSKKLLFLCLSFILGIFLSSVFTITQSIIWAFLLLAVIIISASFFIRGNPFVISVNLCFIGFCILFLCLGVLRHQISLFNIENNNLIELNDKQDQITLVGIVAKEPDNRDKIQRLKIKIENFDGLVLITKNRYPEYNYLDKIEIIGNLKSPMETEDFSYKNYLLKDGIYSVMDFPKTELLSVNHNYNFLTYLFEKILFIKQKLRESIRQIYLPPESLVLEGMILGDSSALTSDLKDKLNITGLRHIIAVSGTHVVILSSILVYLFLFLGFWRGQAFYGSVTFIWLYILLTGLPASGIRAGIMATLFLLAEKLGRYGHRERIIVLACALMLVQNPLLLRYDIGFQLSFLAVLGLIYLDLFIKNFIIKLIENIKYFFIKKRKLFENKVIFNEKLENFIGMISATLSAQIFTIPIMLYNFGNISLIAPVTNILILPIVEPLMILGFVSSFIGIFSTYLSMIFFVPCYFLLYYFIKILDIFSQPFAMKTFENVHWLWVVIIYLLLIVLIKFIKKKERENKFY